MNVSWAYYTPDNPYNVTLYAVVCTPTNQDTGPTVATASEKQIQLEVLRLRALTNYSVQVLALAVNLITGAVTFKGSQILDVSTVEGGKY